MSKKSKAYLICFLWCLTAAALNALPSQEELGKIFGYPASEIVVTDVTGQERLVLESLSARERRTENPKLLSGNQLIAAYHVSAKDPETFYPIIISIAKEGTFLTGEVKTMLADLSTAPATSISKGGTGPLGNFELAEAGESGIYMGKVKRPSRDSAMSEPLERMAMISVMHLASEPLDVKIAFMAALEKGSDLKPVAGGEQYFQRFDPSTEESNALAADVRERVIKLNKLVLDSDEFPAVAAVRERLRNTSRNTVHATEIESSEVSNSSGVMMQSGRIWMTLGAIGLSLVFLFFIMRRKKNDNV